MLNIRHSPKISHATRPKGLVEVQNNNRGTNLRMILNNTADNWSFVYFFASAHENQPLSYLHILPYEIVFHSQPLNPLSLNYILLEIHFLNVLHRTVLIYFTIFNIKKLIYIRCFLLYAETEI